MYQHIKVSFRPVSATRQTPLGPPPFSSSTSDGLAVKTGLIIEPFFEQLEYNLPLSIVIDYNSFRYLF